MCIRDRLITCLDPFDMESQNYQREIGISLALTGTVTALLIVAMAVLSVQHVRRAFREMEALVNKGRGALVAEAQAREAADSAAM